MAKTVQIFGVLAAAALLAACAPTPELIEAGIMQAPTPVLATGVYGAVADDTFTVPAVPEEKVPDTYQRQDVYYPTDEVEGTVVINPSERLLYLVTGKNKATRYGIAVGRDGFQWSGTALITSRQHWPTWTPPPEMIERKPELSKWEKGQPGGPENPLGARALYLTTNGVDYGYRIHGTPEWFSIGQNASSGCIRMINQDVMDLYSRVQDGAKVVVLNADGSYPTALKLPPPAPKKKAAPKANVAAKPAAALGAASGEMVLNPALTAPAAEGTAAAGSATAGTATAVATAAKPVVCPVPLVGGLCPPEALAKAQAAAAAAPAVAPATAATTAPTTTATTIAPKVAQ